MGVIRYIGSFLLILLIFIVTILSSPFFLMGIAWGCGSTAFAAGRYLIVNTIVNKGRKRPSFDASQFTIKRREKK